MKTIKTKKNIMIAKSIGFCYGVRRAIELAEESSKGGKVNTLGPLIHNPSEIKRLEKKGITKVDSLDDVKDSVLIRAHGVPDSIIRRAEKMKLNIIDATCPNVKKLQKIVKGLEKEGYFLVIVGEKDHPEVKGIMSYVENFQIIDDLDEIKKLDFHEKIGVVFQTTQNHEKLEKIVPLIRKKCNELKIKDTICPATTHRQKAAKDVAKKSDLMIVIGGFNSGNTKRLVQICSKIVNTKHVETDKQLKGSWFKGKENIGIAAGASTPDYVIKKIVERIGNFDD